MRIVIFLGLRKAPSTEQEGPCHPGLTVTLNPRHPPPAASINIWHLCGQNKARF